MDAAALQHVIEQIGKCPLQTDPYPYFTAQNVFPDEFYEELLGSFPPTDSYINLEKTGRVPKGAYPERYTLPLNESHLQQLPFVYSLFWKRFSEALHSDFFLTMLLEKFRPFIQSRFQKPVNIFTEAALIRDRSNYSIGPHTDHPSKILTLLFYFPSGDEQSHLGTSIYRPRDAAFRCEGFAHHPFEPFIKTYTAPFLPNSVFGFFKSDVSFHGVEPIGEQKVERNLMSYSISWK